MQNMKLIHSKRQVKLKFSHSFMLFLSAVCILLILFCIFCIAFKLLPCVVCIFLPYAICAAFGLILYLVLIPLHEAGHFYTALYYIKKYNIPAKVYIKRSMTISAEWENFGNTDLLLFWKTAVGQRWDMVSLCSSWYWLWDISKVA